MAMIPQPQAIGEKKAFLAVTVSPFCPRGWILDFLRLPLTSLSSRLGPMRKLQSVAFLRGEPRTLCGQTHPHLITHKPLGGQM